MNIESTPINTVILTPDGIKYSKYKIIQWVKYNDQGSGFIIDQIPNFITLMTKKGLTTLSLDECINDGMPTYTVDGCRYSFEIETNGIDVISFKMVCNILNSKLKYEYENIFSLKKVYK